MVDYHYMFLIFKCFWLYPNLNEVVSIGSNLIWAVVICPNIYNNLVCKSEWNSSNVPRWFQLYPGLNEAVSITQNMIESVGICLNVSNCKQIWIKFLHITRFEMKLNWIWSSPKLSKAVWSSQKWIKLFEVTQKLNENVPLGSNLNGALAILTRVDLVCWNLPKFFQSNFWWNDYVAWRWICFSIGTIWLTRQRTWKLICNKSRNLKPPWSLWKRIFNLPFMLAESVKSHMLRYFYVVFSWNATYLVF